MPQLVKWHTERSSSPLCTTSSRCVAVELHVLGIIIIAVGVVLCQLENGLRIYRDPSWRIRPLLPLLAHSVKLEKGHAIPDVLMACLVLLSQRRGANRTRAEVWISFLFPTSLKFGLANQVGI